MGVFDKKTTDRFEIVKPKVTFRDVLNEAGDLVARQNINLGQSILRSFGAFGAKIEARDTNASFKPRGQFQKDLFGTEEDISFSSIGAETRKGFGGTKESTGFDPVLGGLIVAADILPGGRTGKTAATKFVEITDTGSGVKVLRKVLDSDVDRFAKLFSKAGKATDKVIDGKVYNFINRAPRQGEKITKTLKWGDVPVKAGNIRLDKFDLPLESIDEMARIIKDNDDFILQRRGIQTFEDTLALSQDIIPKPRLKAGTALNAEELHSLGRQIATTRTRLDDLSSIVKSGANSDIELLEHARLQEELGVLIGSFAGATAETGRALNSIKIMKKAGELGDSDFIKKAIDLAGGRESIENVAKALASFDSNDLVGKYRYLRNLQKPGARDWLSWYWYTNLLSGPKTQVRNILGSMSNITFDVPTKPFAAGADFFTSALKGKEREVFIGEVGPQITGYLAGSKKGFAKANFILKNGFSMDDVAKLDFRPPEVQGGIYTNIIGRSLDAADNFFRSMASEGELYSRAFTAGKKSKLTGKALEEFVDNFVTNPPVEVMKDVAKAGSSAVFRAEPGPLVKKIIGLKSDFKLNIRGKEKTVFNPIKFLAPFVSTPANIVKKSLEASPLGFFSAALKNTARERSIARGRAALGTVALTPLAIMVTEGRVSGSGPKDREIRDLLFQTGWRPNSIKIGDNWYNYSNFQPLALPLSLIANAYETYHYDTGEFNPEDIATIIFKTGDSLLNQSYLQGLSAFQQALADPEIFGKAFLQRFASSLIPATGFRGQLTRAIDDTVRKPDTTIEKIKSEIPGLSDEVKPRVTTLGTEATRETGLSQPFDFLSRFLSPVDISPDRSTPLTDELLRLEDLVQVGFPARTFSVNNRKIELDDDQYNELQQIAGEGIKEKLERQIESRNWEKLSDEAKSERIKRIVEQERASARKQILRIFPELRQR